MIAEEVLLQSNKTPRSFPEIFVCNFDDYLSAEENICSGIEYTDIRGESSFAGLSLDLIEFTPSISYITDYTSVCKNFLYLKKFFLTLILDENTENNKICKIPFNFEQKQSFSCVNYQSIFSCEVVGENQVYDECNLGLLMTSKIGKK